MTIAPSPSARIASFVFRFAEARDSSEVAESLHACRAAFGDGLRPVKESRTLMRYAVDLGLSQDLARLTEHIAFASSGSPSFLFMYLDAATSPIYRMASKSDGTIVFGSRADFIFRTVARSGGRWDFIDYAEHPPEFIAALVAHANAYGVETSDSVIEGIRQGKPPGAQCLAAHCQQQWREPLPSFAVTPTTGPPTAFTRDVHDQLAVCLRRNTTGSLLEALTLLGIVARTCEGDDQAEVLLNAAEMTEPVFRGLAASYRSGDLLSEGLFDQGCEVLEKVLQAKEPRGPLATYYYHLAGFYQERKEYRRATNLFSLAAEVVRKLGRWDLELLALYRQVLCSVMLGWLQDATKSAGEAWDIALGLNNQPMRARLDDLFNHLNAAGISKPERQVQMSFRVKRRERLLASTAYRFTVIHPDGLLVPCGRMVELLMKLQGDVKVETDERSANGKSILELLTLAVPPGSTISMTFSQPQDGPALDPLIMDGVLVPEGTDAWYVCHECRKEVHIQESSLTREQVCSACGNRNLVRLGKYRITTTGG